MNEKLKRFAHDKVMFESVKTVLLKSFLKDRKNTDVNTLAAERIAIILLEEGFKELQRYSEVEREPIKRIGEHI